MTAIFGNSTVLWGSRNLLGKPIGPSLNQLFRRCVHTSSTDTSQKVKISPEVKKWLLKERAKQEQDKLEKLRDGMILDGLPKPGDRFYNTSWEILTNDIKKHSQ